MKNYRGFWLIVLVGILFVLSGWVITWYDNDQEFVESVDWMYENNFTQYNTITAFMPWSTVTREQWAKFLSELWKLTYWEDDFKKSTQECQFNDLWDADITLTESIIYICQAWIMQWHNNAFSPKDPMTKAQVITTLIRMETWILDETISPWRQHYYLRAFNQWLTREHNTWQLDQALTRYEMALLLSRAAGNEFGVQTLQDEIDEITELLSLWEWLQEGNDSQ